jgi:hypothetical protein
LQALADHNVEAYGLLAKAPSAGDSAGLAVVRRSGFGAEASP